MKYPASLSRMIFTPIVGLFVCLVFSIITPAAFGQTAPSQQDQQQPTIKIPTALVNVPVMVTDNYGRFITGLRQGDFTVREDGVAQKIDLFSSTEEPFKVALLIDTSHSTQNKLAAIRKAALAFIKQLLPNDRVMVVTFDDRVQFICDFTNDHATLEHAIRSVKSGYATSLYDAIHRTINEKLLAVSGRKAIVVLTDGVDTASKTGTFENTLDLVAATGIVSYAIQYETRNDGGPLMKPIFLPGRPMRFASN